jgi:hypothetical protein
MQGGEMSGGVISVEGGWLLPLDGYFIGPVTVGLDSLSWKLSRFRSGGGANRPTLNIRRCWLATHHADRVRLSRETWKEHGNQAPRIGTEITRALARTDGGLEVLLADGSQLVVEPERYEAWELVGPGSLMVVSPAGGGEPAISG